MSAKLALGGVFTLGGPGLGGYLDALRSGTATKGIFTVKQYIRGLRRAAVLTAAAATLVTLTAGAGNAGTRATTTPPQAAAAAVHPDFSAQARNAGLTAAEATTLQTEVNGYLARTGGTQISANQILLANGSGEVTVPLPGRHYAADLVAPTAATPAISDGLCDYRNFCVFSDTAYQGTRWEWFYCGTYGMPWTTVGSFDDYQTPGTVSTIETVDGNINIQPHLLDPDIDWAPVYAIRIC